MFEELWRRFGVLVNPLIGRVGRQGEALCFFARLQFRRLRSRETSRNCGLRIRNTARQSSFAFRREWCPSGADIMDSQQRGYGLCVKRGCQCRQAKQCGDRRDHQPAAQPQTCTWRLCEVNKHSSCLSFTPKSDKCNRFQPYIAQLVHLKPAICV